MSRMRELLAKEIADKVRRHGLVIWEDRAGEYADVASSLVLEGVDFPDGVDFAAFDGSWYALRRRIEAAVSGERPQTLVVYVPAAAEPDLLAEVRDAATTFTRRLAKLVEQAHRGHLAPARISAIGREARTIGEAEAAAESTTAVDARLIAALGASDPIEMLVGVLAGSADAALGEVDLWAKVSELATGTVGGRVAGSGDELRESLFLHAMLCEIDSVTDGSLPRSLAATWQPPPAAQRRNAPRLLERLRAATDGAETYRRLAEAADIRLAMAGPLEWVPGLDGAVGTRAVEEAALAHTVGLLQTRCRGRAAEIAKIAERRLQVSAWVSDAASGWGATWRAVLAVAALHAALDGAEPPRSKTSGQMLAWYAEHGWQVDRAHRRLETACTRLATFGELEDVLVAARAAYEEWLDGVLRLFVSTLEGGALEVDGLIRQGEVHDRFVADASGRTAYVWVDALRYELGEELANALEQTGAVVRIEAAVAAAPTITEVGMANLLPGASTGLMLGLEGDDLRVSVGGKRVSTVGHRRDLLRARHGRVADLDLNEASQKGERELSESVGDADLVLIRSQEVDASGESGLLSVAWTDFETVIELLANLTARLARCGVDRIVIAADHGFIALSRNVGADRTIPAPAGAVGTTKRRVFVGQGSVPHDATVRVPLAACGISGDLDLVVPRGLAVFSAGGGRQFFHGGLSPQELIVPVIVAELTGVPEPLSVRVGIAVAGERITTGVFSATLTFDGDLFANQVTVRVVARSRGAPVVARVVSGDGYDPEGGTVTVGAGGTSVLTVQVTENLTSGTYVILQVIDARTGLALASPSVPVAATVTVKDELG